jgi:hypothetical protein
LATTLLVIPMFAPYNQLLLLPAVMIAVRSRLWQKSRYSRFLCSIAALSIAWQFLAAACLIIALAFLSAATVQRVWVLPIYLSFATPIMVYAVLLASRRILSDQAQAAMH